MKGQSAGCLEIYQNVTVRHISPDTACSTLTNTRTFVAATLETWVGSGSNWYVTSRRIIGGCSAEECLCFNILVWVFSFILVFALLLRLLFFHLQQWDRKTNKSGNTCVSTPESKIQHIKARRSLRRFLNSLNTPFNHSETHGCIGSFSCIQFSEQEPGHFS